jgi:hypothetical protein
MSKERFRINENHLKLLNRLHFEWCADDYDGYPTVNSKRPYGNSDVLDDVAEIIEMPVMEDDDGKSHYPKGTKAKCKQYHEEMATVLQIVSSTMQVSAGLYIKQDQYDCLSWVKEHN